MPFACIFVPDFPVEAVLRAEPELRSQAVAVLEGKPPLQKIFAVNEKARQAGIEPGMTKIQVDACSGLVLRSRAPLQETAAHAALLDCAQSFSPRIEDTAPDTILLDLSGLESLFGPPSRIACDVARRVADLGLEANVAVASNPDTAQIAARGFSGVTIIPEGKEAERLGNLPLEVLLSVFITPGPSQEPAQLLQTFDLWGVRNFRALCALPEIALSERMGQQGVRLQQLARGATSRTLVPVDPPLVFEEAVELEYPLVLLEPLAFLLARMLDQLCARLGSRALAAQELRLHLELDSTCQFTEDLPEPEMDHAETIDSSTASVEAVRIGADAPDRVETDALVRPGRAPARQFTPSEFASNATRTYFTRTLRLPVPMLDARVFLKLLQLDLKSHPPGAPIVKVRIAAEPARPRAAQAGLFLPPVPEPEKMELIRARIAGLVGEDKVGSAELLDTHRPQGFCMQRLAPASPAELKKELKRHPHPNPNMGAPPKLCLGGFVDDAPLTALRMFRPPLRAAVTLHNGQPVHLACMKRKDVQGEILWCAGPWRSSGDWWEQDGWSRDEWDIALQKNETLVLFRLVHDLLSGRWFVEGTYD
jgi:protein ImuB